MHKLNKTYLGAIVGLLVPAIAITIFVLFSEFELDWANQGNHKLNLKRLSPFLRLGLIPNMIFFIPFRRPFPYKFLRGVILSTFVYGLAIFIIWML